MGDLMAMHLISQANNTVVKEYGERRMEEKLYNHVDLVSLLGIVDLEAGQTVAGGRGYYLINEGVLLNQVRYGGVARC